MSFGDMRVDFLCSKCQKKLTVLEEVCFCETDWDWYTFCKDCNDELHCKFDGWLGSSDAE